MGLKFNDDKYAYVCGNNRIKATAVNRQASHRTGGGVRRKVNINTGKNKKLTKENCEFLRFIASK